MTGVDCKAFRYRFDCDKCGRRRVTYNHVIGCAKAKRERARERKRQREVIGQVDEDLAKIRDELFE